MNKCWIGLLWLLMGIPSLWAQQHIHPDDIEQAWEELERRREAMTGQKPIEFVHLGIWEEPLDSILSVCPQIDSFMAKAWLHYLSADFSRAEWICEQQESVLPAEFRLQLSILLAMQRWELPLAKRLIADGYSSDLSPVWLTYQQGTIGLWEKQYQTVAQQADSLVRHSPEESLAWLLKAKAAFWLLDLETAELALIECLNLDPFNADARFWYGYVIWRKREASLLDEMAAQWELALAIHPLHFLTHWHWGNGHTNLTYADYYDPDEETIRRQLSVIDSLEGINNRQAFTLLQTLQQGFPESVITELYLASEIYQLVYLASEAEAVPELKLPSTQIFQQILQKKPHYGPAHNGLAAVLKQKQIQYLAAYDSLEQVIDETVIDRPESFYSVFPDVTRYHGPRVANMVYGQLHTSVAYLDMLDSLDRTFAIPPLHEDLAIAMDDPWFRGATTFDNRQWMDIRGVGSGATGIEYVERGSHLERNVTLHEFVHLFHGTVLTDREQRRIRNLYNQAMEQNFTLDYYARNNEFEYFAQAFPAYFSTIKVHPLNHKSVNTREDLIQRDPDLYAFIDSMVQRQQAWLQGDSSALASNWAQTYLRLADQALFRQNFVTAQAYLDRAFDWDSSYLPLYLAQVHLAASQTYWVEATKCLDMAEQQFPHAASIHMVRAEYAVTRYRQGILSARETVAAYLDGFRKACDLETDPLIRAEWQADFRQTMKQFARWDLLVNETESYLATTDTTSTYLREFRDDALADLAWVKGMLGYGHEADSILVYLVLRKPQNLRYRIQYSEVLLNIGRINTAENVIDEIRQIYEAADHPQVSLDYLWIRATNDEELMDSYLSRERIPATWRAQWFMLQILSEDSSRIAAWEAQLPEPIFPRDKAMYLLNKGLLHAQEGQLEEAELMLRKAVETNPFDFLARSLLIMYLMESGKEEAGMLVAREGQLLPIPPGPNAPEWAEFDIPQGGEE